MVCSFPPASPCHALFLFWSVLLLPSLGTTSNTATQLSGMSPLTFLGYKPLNHSRTHAIRAPRD